jgi:iron complex outermembrane recepter protein
MKKTYLATAVATLFVSSVTTAIAADTLLDDVVVSSSRSEQRSFDAPGSIQSVGREVIQSSGPQVNLSETLASVPGVTILNRQNYAQDLQVSIRGFGARTKFGVRGVRLIIDGIPATIPDGQGQSSSISLTSTDRIEVLRGPIAQLYGNSAGGVIQAFTREAPDQPELLVQGYLGSYGTNRTDWQYAQKVGQFGLVADYSTFKTDGFRQNSQTERNQFNGKLTYDHDDKTRVSFVANIFDMPYAYDAKGLNWADSQSRPNYSSNYGDARRYRKQINQEQVGLILEHKIDSQTLIKTFGYLGHRENTHVNSGDFFVGLDRDYGGVGFELQKKSSLLQMPSNYVVGFNIDRSKEINNRGSINSVGEINDPFSSRKENREAKNIDLYAQNTLQVADKWSAVAGFRATQVKLSSNDLKSGAYSGEKSFSAVNPVLGLTHHYADNLNLYLNYGRGFETPTLGELGYVNNSNNSGTESGWNSRLQASNSNHYETGFKWLVNAKSRLDGSLFYIKTQNELLVDIGGTNPSYKNAGGTTRKGFELAAQSYLKESLRGLLSVTYISATFDESSTQTAGTTNGNVLSGYKLPGIPQSQVYGQLSWSSTDFVKNKYRQVLGTVVSAEFISSGKIFVSDNNVYSTNTGKAFAPGYSTYNLKLSHKWDVNNLTFTGLAQLNNLTDKKYIGSVIVGESSAPFEPAPGRNWMIGLNATARF